MSKTFSPYIRDSKYPFLVRNLLDTSEYSNSRPFQPEVERVSHDIDNFVAFAVEIGLQDPPDGWYFARCLDVINITIMYTRHCLVPERCKRRFKPVFVQEIFGDKQEIYGYHNLHVDIYYLANSARCFVDVRYTGIAKPPLQSAPDDILKQLSPWLPRDYKTEEFSFLIKLCTERRTQMFGTEMERVQIYNSTDNASYNYIFTSCRNDDPQFKEFHARFQCMTVWFFKKPRLIDVEDPNWLFIYVYEERTEEKMEGVYPVGFIIVHKYLSYPDRTRARIAQLFVMPPCQRMGIGTHLLRNAYKELAALDNIVEIVGQEPNESFTSLRNMLDCELLMKFQQFNCENIHQGYKADMYKVANKAYKLNKHQVRRVYEILRMAYIECNMLDTNYKLLLDEISNRLKIPFKKQIRIFTNLLQNCPNDNKIQDVVQKLRAVLDAKIITYMNGIQMAATLFNAKLLKPSFE